MEDLDEKAMLLRIKNGEIDLFRYFVDKYSRIALYYVLKKVSNAEDAKDIVQNAFFNVYRALDRFDTNRPFYPYFFSVLKNEINQFFRSNKKSFPLFEDSISETDELLYSFDLSMVFAGIRPEYKKVLELYYVQGYSYKEIAELLGKPINTIKTLISRAKVEVKEVYERKKEK